MKKNIIYFIVGLVILNIFNLIFSHSDLFNLMVVTTLYLIFISSFSHVKYNKNASFISLFVTIIIICLIYFIISFLIGNFIFLRLRLLFIIMGLSVIVVPCINIFKDVMSRKKSLIITILFYTVLGLVTIIMMLLYRFMKLDINIVGSIIYLSGYIILIPLVILNRKMFKYRELNLRKAMLILSKNVRSTFIKLSNLCYYYLSIIILYFSLTDLYLYYDKAVTTVLVDVYLYCYYIVAFLSYIFYSKEDNDNINSIYIDIIKKVLPILILFSILSGPILLILFNNIHNAYIFSLLVFEVLFIIMYNVAVNKLMDKKNFNIIIILGIVIKCIITIPMINSFYRMGYSMIYGDIISTMIALLIVIIITIIYFNKIQKYEFSVYFGNVLNVIYENIILCLILILLQLFVPVIPRNIIHAIGIIIVYVVVFIIYNRCKRLVMKT